MGFYQFKQEQLLKASVSEVWDFISSPENLKEITPASMGFEITSGEVPEKMYPGMIVSYRVRPVLNIPTKWVTEITQVEEGKFFVDEQREGPYRMWHHQHILEEVEGDVLMKDIVSYVPPFGYLGVLANALFIGRKLEKVFAFRRKVLANKWPDQ